MEHKKINKRAKNFVQLTSIPVEMLVIILAGYKLGNWLDEKYPNENSLYTIIATLSGVFIAMIRVVMRVQRLSK